MADPKKPARPAAIPARPAAGEQLEELNDQLGRFLQHADQLVEDWARFGADVRRTVDTEVGRIDQAVVDAVDRASRQLEAEADRVAADKVQRAIDHAMQKLRGSLAAGGGGTSAASPAAAASAAAAQGPARYLLGAVVLADLLLVILLVMVWRKDPAPAAAAKDGGAAIGTAADSAVAPEVANACASLAAGTYSIEAADLVLGARGGLDACGSDAAAVRAVLHQQLEAAAGPPVDAGVPDGPPLDAKPKRPPR